MGFRVLRGLRVGFEEILGLRVVRAVFNGLIVLCVGFWGFAW